MSEETLQLIDEINIDKCKYASNSDKILFMTDNMKTIPISKIRLLENKINRTETMTKIAKLIKDIDAAVRIESGIFEFTLVYCSMKSYIDSMLSAVYNDKVFDTLQNLDPNNVVQNKTLCNAIYDGTINPQTIAFLRPRDVHPDRWDSLVKKAELKEYKKNNMAVTDLYTCWKCKEKRCKVMQLQMRSSDEPMTSIITCLNCYTVMKKG